MKSPIAIAAALAVLALPAAADAASRNRQHHHHRGAGSYARAQPQIACTRFGCIPVPRGCHARAGRTLDGSPSGFEVVVCGNASLYGNY